MKNKNSIIVWIIVAAVLILIIAQPKKDIKKMAGCTTGNCVNFGATDGTISMSYGGNEDGNWYEFSTRTNLQQYHNDLSHGYIRVWLSAQWYRRSTFPLKSDGTYDWANFDLFMDAITSINVKPMVLFAHGDKCNSNTPFDFSNCEGHGVLPPSNNNQFSDYAATVTQHLVDRYGYNEVNTWYFEILNEPYGWSNYQPYWDLFALSKQRIKAIVPNAKVGGGDYGGTAGALNAGFEFIDRHLYPGNLATATTDQQRMDTTTLMYNKIVSIKNQAGSAEVISGEYNIDLGNAAYSNMQRPFVGSYLVSALINEIKAGAVMEMTYQSTCSYHNNAGCMGMWHIDGTKFDNYNKKKIFSEINKKGSIYHTDNYDSSQFDIIGTSNSDGNFITIVNKKGNTNSINLEVANSNSQSFTDLVTGEVYTLSGNSLSLSFTSFETKFLKAVGGNSAYPYSEFIIQKNTYLSGGLLSAFIMAANSWVII